MASAETPLRSRPRLSALSAHRAPGRSASLVQIVSNPVADQDGGLGEALESIARAALRDEGLGRIEVRFRVCREEKDGLTFICKVENPPRRDSDPGFPAWRWWSPLLTTAEGFESVLREAVDGRRQRLASARPAQRSAS